MQGIGPCKMAEPGASRDPGRHLHGHAGMAATMIVKPSDVVACTNVKGGVPLPSPDVKRSLQ
jgi:hypothetical protein